MLNKLEEVADRFREVEGLLSDHTVMNDQNRYRSLTKEHSELIDVVRQAPEACFFLVIKNRHIQVFQK